MCQWCIEHTARKAWYLKPQNHKTGTLNRFQRFWDWHIDMGILYGTIDKLADKDKEWGFPKKQLMNLYAKKVHGGQVVASMDEALKVLDLAEDVYLTYCACRKSMHEEHEKVYKCLLLNNDAKNAKRYDANAKLKGKPTLGNFIDPEEAKEIVLTSRKEYNCFQSVYWKWAPHVAVLCNCDHFCGSWKTLEVPLGQVASFKYSKVINPDDCDSCGACLDVCYKHVISLTEYGPVVNSDLCIGCGLCVDNCHKNVYKLEPREVIYDVEAGKKVNLKSLALSK